jgi:membrane fusion protein, multidrug efflux system
VATLAMGQAAHPLAFEVFDRNDQVALANGTLALIDNQIDRTTNTVRLKAIFANADGMLRPGEFVNAHLRKSVLRNAAAVPPGVIQDDEQGSFAWLVRPDSTVIPRRVVLGPASDGLVTIESGLSPGDRVVVDGQYNLHANAAVSMKPRAMASTTDSSALSIP